MAYKTIVVFLLSIFVQIVVFAQTDTLREALIIRSGEDPQPATTRLYREIDSLIDVAIKQGAFPGCVVYGARKGVPFFEKAYGFHTYDSLTEVKLTDIYDLASVSKSTGAALALMKLYEMNLLQLDAPLSDYVDGFGWNRRGKSTIREALTHQAGFQGWIKYYEKIIRNNGKYKRKTIAKAPSKEYSYPLANGMYLHKDFYRQIKKLIKRSDFNRDKPFIYSDLFFYLVPEIVHNMTGLGYDEFLGMHFYDSLGAHTLGFNPIDRFGPERIVPTEIDTFFRMEPIHGRVHDEGAILMQGISGHAGLFSNVQDLARVWQMLLNGGTYQGKVYLKPSTIQLFTSYQFPQSGNRKAMGFDKPMIEYDEVISSIAESASVFSFGHTGFTGPLVWADPYHDFLFVFLTNRVYPTRESKAIYTLNLRPTLHEIFYRFLEEGNGEF